MNSTLLLDLESSTGDVDEEPLLVELSSKRRGFGDRPVLQVIGGDSGIQGEDSCVEVTRLNTIDDSSELLKNHKIWADRLDHLLESSTSFDENSFKKLLSSNVKKLRDNVEGSRESLSKWMNHVSNDDSRFDKKSKQRLLAATMILLKWFRVDHRDEIIIHCFELYFECLVRICQNAPSLRTNLTAECSKIVCLLVHRCANVASSDRKDNASETDSFKTNARDIIWNALSLIRQFLLCKKQWNETKSNEKQKCNKAVIIDFLNIVEENTKFCRALNDPNQDTLMDSKVNLCTALAGTASPISEASQDDKIFGGFNVLEFDLSKKVSIEALINALNDVSFLHKSNTDGSIDYVNELQRCITREFVAWLGSKSDTSLLKIISQEAETVNQLIQTKSMEACLRLLSCRCKYCIELSLISL